MNKKKILIVILITMLLFATSVIVYNNTMEKGPTPCSYNSETGIGYDYQGNGYSSAFNLGCRS